jgi:AcrR family transcriptional regulator
MASTIKDRWAVVKGPPVCKLWHMTFQRARSEEQREIRRRTILDTAAAMLDEMPVADVTLNELSRRVGLAKSNVLRYFESREAVLFELLQRAWQRWLAEVPDELAAGVDPRLSALERGDQVAAVLSASLARQTVLCDLLNAQTNVLEHNVSVDVALRHKRSALAGIATTAGLIRQHVPELDDGARMVAVMTLILAGALSTYCQPSASALAAYEADPTVYELQLHLRESLEYNIATLIAGTLARS